MTAAQALTDEEKLSWLQLARSENVGAITFHKLIDRYGTADAAIEALPETVEARRRRTPVAYLPAVQGRSGMGTCGPAEMPFCRLVGNRIPKGAVLGRRCAATAHRARPP